MYPEDPPEPTTEEYYEDQLAQAVAYIRELEADRDLWRERALYARRKYHRERKLRHDTAHIFAKELAGAMWDLMDTAKAVDELRAENRRLFGALQDLEAAHGQIAPEDWPALIEDVVLQLIYELEATGE